MRICGTCASLAGQVINWGAGGEGGVTTELKDGSWQVSTISATDGNYGFGGLGIGAAKLHVTLAPELTESLQPNVQDAGIYLNCDYATIANIAVSGAVVNPPATISMSAGRTALGPGDRTQIMLTINNGLPTDITNVVVTNIIPQGLIAVDVSAVVVRPRDLVAREGVADRSAVPFRLGAAGHGQLLRCGQEVVPVPPIL